MPVNPGCSSGKRNAHEQPAAQEINEDRQAAPQDERPDEGQVERGDGRLMGRSSPACARWRPVADAASIARGGPSRPRATASPRPRRPRTSPVRNPEVAVVQRVDEDRHEQKRQQPQQPARRPVTQRRGTTPVPSSASNRKSPSMLPGRIRPSQRLSGFTGFQAAHQHEETQRRVPPDRFAPARRLASGAARRERARPVRRADGAGVRGQAVAWDDARGRGPIRVPGGRNAEKGQPSRAVPSSSAKTSRRSRSIQLERVQRRFVDQTSSRRGDGPLELAQRFLGVRTEHRIHLAARNIRAG